MKSLANAVLAQGAGAEQNSISLNSTFSPLKIALFMVLLAISASSLSAQYTEEDVENFTFSATVPAGTYQSGDVVKADIHLGASSNPVKDLLGFDLWLDLGGLARPAGSHPSMDFEGSCLISSNAFDSTTAWSPSTDTYSFEAILGAGASGTGTGRVVSIWLEITANNVDASSVIARAGGLALIENISGKQAATVLPQAEEVKVFPIPATHTLYLDPASTAAHAQLYALDGRLLTEIALPAAGRTQIDVSALPRGLALLVFDDGSHRRIALE